MMNVNSQTKNALERVRMPIWRRGSLVKVSMSTVAVVVATTLLQGGLTDD